MKRISHLLIAKKSVVARKSVVEKRRVVEKIRASVSYFMLGLSVVMLFMTGKPVFAESELLIEITSGRIDSTKIAVVPFRWSGRGVLDEDVARIIGADLERSGQFQSMGRSNMLSRPSRASEVLFEEWRTMGMEYLVIGEILDVEGNQFEFNFQLFDVFSGELLEERRGRAGNLRDISHHIADKIYEKLTGLRGAFSTKLLYISVNKLRPGHMDYRLQIADADGFRPRTIQQSNEPILSPAWSPDGKKVAYSTFFNRKPAIFVQDLASGQRQKVSAFKGINGAPDWSPDGRHLAMTLSKDGNAEIYLLELATERWTRVTNHYAIDTEPRWSPDGQYLIFTSNRGGSVQIYRYLLADRTVSRMTYEGSYNARGDISHDGQYLVMVHRRKGQFHIAIQDIDKRTLNILSETALDESPTIAPNGSMLIYATLDGDQGILSAVSFDGRVKFRIPSRRGDVREPSWSPFL